MTQEARWLTLGAMILGCIGAGCGVLSVPERRAVSNPLIPLWNTAHIRQHLTFMHGRSVRGRVDGTVGYGVAASYVAERLKDYGLQPATSGDFRLLYNTPRNLVRASRLRIGDRDSVSLRPGVDFQPDGRSGNSFVAVSGLGISEDDDEWTGPAIPILRRGHQQSEGLFRLRDAGVPIVLVEQDSLVPRPAPIAITGLGVLNLTRAATDRILAGSHSTTTLGQGVLRLRLPIRIEIIADADPTASGINVVGFVPGKDPLLSREAVILCTHLDAVGNFGGADFLDLHNYGVEVAAVLDVARQYAMFAELTRIPERTLIVALVAGGTIDSGGLKALLRQPVWDTRKVRSIVYVGTPAGGRQALQQAIGQTSASFQVVVAGDTIPDAFVPVYSISDARTRPAEPNPRNTRADHRAYLPEAVRSASELAGRLYSVVGMLLMSDERTTADTSAE